MPQAANLPAFKPAAYLRNAHLQTIWPSFFRRRPPLAVEWERMELADGDFIDLAWHAQNRPQAPLVLLMHGLEGSLDSHYTRALMQALQQAGFNGVFMTLRGCGRDANRLDHSYHSGQTADLHSVLQQLQARAQLPVAAIGISLSANLLLKYLGEQAERSLLQAAVAISPPFQLAPCAQRLQQGFSRVYGRYLLNKLKPSFRAKFQNRPCPLDVDLDTIQTMYEFDDQITAPLNGFMSADDYYTRSSCFPCLRAIHTPSLIIHAADDPFMTPDIVPSEADVSDAVSLAISPYGGHVGFMHGTPWRLRYWLDEAVPNWLAQQFDLAPVNAATPDEPHKVLTEPST